MKIIRLGLLLTAIAPVFAESSGAQSSVPSARPAAVTVSAIQEQSDVVLGKKKLTGALLDQVIVWYGINPKHPTALAKAQELRGSYKSLLDENIVLLDMLREYRIQTRGKADLDTLLTLSEHVNEVANHSDLNSKLRQLETVGFDPRDDHFAPSDVTQSASSDTNTSNAGSFWSTFMSKLSVLYAVWF